MNIEIFHFWKFLIFWKFQNFLKKKLKFVHVPHKQFENRGQQPRDSLVWNSSSSARALLSGSLMSVLHAVVAVAVVGRTRSPISVATSSKSIQFLIVNNCTLFVYEAFNLKILPLIYHIKPTVYLQMLRKIYSLIIINKFDVCVYA